MDLQQQPVLSDYHVADLTKGMEHMRAYVSVPSTHNPTPPAQPPQPTSTTTTTTTTTRTTQAEEPLTYGIPSAIINPLRQPATSTTNTPSPSNPEKRTDPFQFGSRTLLEGDDIFSFNAWDHVEVDSAYTSFAETQYLKQRESPVSDFDKQRFNTAPERWWNKFYANNAANFFKDRKWLFQEFPSLEKVTRAGAGEVRVLEVGAGAGNTAFPIVAANRNVGLRVHACDFSSTSIGVIRGKPEYEEYKENLQADVWDVAAEGTDGEEVCLPPNVERGSVDIVILIFIFSALAPAQWTQALRNIDAVLKPGGEILLRDYGRGDLAQVRFKKGRYLEDNFYIRGDGTRVYFFEKEELEEIFTGKVGENRGEQTTEEQENDGQDVAEAEPPAPAQNDTGRPRFETLDLAVDRRMLVNRQRKLKMYRCWMQGRFRKPAKGTTEEEEEG